MNRQNSNTASFPTPPSTPGTSGNGNGNGTSSDTQNRQGQSQRPRLIVDFSDLNIPLPTTPRTLQPEELRRLFLFSLEKMFTLEPESICFRQPVDPEAQGLTDYNDIIRKPMDLQTIRIKMNCLKYTDPWMYVDDVILMFDNAWVFNRPTSIVYQYCTKLAEVFQDEINPVMQRLGHKHGRIHQFNSQTLSCYGKPVCLIKRNETYYNFLRFHLCQKCYSENMQEDAIKLPWQNNAIVGKENFVQLVNDCENAYSPAAELHRAYQRDAEMSRQLVIREFLKLLYTSTTNAQKKANIRRMLRLNPQLHAELVHHFEQQRDRCLLTPKEIEKIEVQLNLINLNEEDKKGDKTDGHRGHDHDHDHEHDKQNGNEVDLHESAETASTSTSIDSISGSNLNLGIEMESCSSNSSTLSSIKSLT